MDSATTALSASAMESLLRVRSQSLLEELDSDDQASETSSVDCVEDDSSVDGSLERDNDFTGGKPP